MSRHPLQSVGRPAHDDVAKLDRHILSIASELFIREGYAGTSVEEVVTTAGISKATLYRRYPSKKELFKAVLVERGRLLLSLTETAVTSPVEPLEGLRNFASDFLDFVLLPETLETYRLLIADGLRIPDVRQSVLIEIDEPFRRQIMSLLRRVIPSDVMAGDDDLKELMNALIGLFTGWPLQRGLLGDTGLADEPARTRFFDVCWTMFLANLKEILERR